MTDNYRYLKVNVMKTPPCPAFRISNFVGNILKRCCPTHFRISLRGKQLRRICHFSRGSRQHFKKYPQSRSKMARSTTYNTTELMTTTEIHLEQARTLGSGYGIQRTETANADICSLHGLLGIILFFAFFMLVLLPQRKWISMMK